MRLLYITNGIIGAGGLERVLAIKASELAEKMGYEVHILTLNQSNDPLFYEFSPKIIMHNITVGGNPISYIIQYRQAMRETVKKIKPDVISVCDDGFKGFFLPILLGKPCVMIYERHVSKVIAVGSNPSVFKQLRTNIKFRAMNALAKKFDKFVVLTKDNLKEWELPNLAVIPNPLSFYPSESAALKNKKVIAVGRQSYQKGYDLLLKSWKLVNEEHPDWKLDIYGKNDPNQGLAVQAATLGLDESVSFYDPVKQIQEKYLEASIYVMSSRFEGFGMVLIEAMACGVPCVSFDCPCGPADIISHEQDGLLVPNGDVTTLAESISKLIKNETLRSQMGNNAKVNVKRFLPEKIVGQWDQLFRTLVKK